MKEKNIWMKKKRLLPRMERMWKKKVTTAKKRMENDREVGGRESRQADGL